MAGCYGVVAVDASGFPLAALLLLFSRLANGSCLGSTAQIPGSSNGSRSRTLSRMRRVANGVLASIQDSATSPSVVL